jgi:hypothetical protein
MTSIVERTSLGTIRREWTAYLHLLLRRRPHNVRVLILDSLSLERRPVRTSLQKVNQRRLRDIVENYDEFAAWASELGYAEALDEAPKSGAERANS